LIKAKSNYKEKSVANNVEIFVPVPEDVEAPNFKAPIGNVSYVP
jgi:AP-1 complex subunit mu